MANFILTPESIFESINRSLSILGWLEDNEYQVSMYGNNVFNYIIEHTRDISHIVKIKVKEDLELQGFFISIIYVRVQKIEL